MRFNRRTTGALIALFSVIGFGLSPVCTRASYAEGANAAYAVIILTLIRTFMLCAICVVKKKRLFATRADMKAGISSGLFQTASSLGNIMALLYLPAPVSVTIAYSHTIMLLFFLSWRGRMKMTAAAIYSSLVALFGLTLVIDLWNVEDEINLIGVALALVAALALAGRFYIYDQQARDQHPAVVGAESFICTTVMIFVITLFFKPHMPATLDGHLWMLLSGLSSGIATIMLFYSISMIGSFNCSLLMKTEPVFVILFSFLILGESLLWQQYIGIACVILSLAIYQFIQHKNPPLPVEPAA